MTIRLVWFREDLRVSDNPALSAAMSDGHETVAVFVLDEVSPGIRPLGRATQWWLHHSLESLRAQLHELGVPLLLKRGPAVEIITETVSELNAAALFWNRRYGLAEREIDRTLKEHLRSNGMRVESFAGSLLFEPWTVQTGAGKPYSVFTPFYRACLAQLTPRTPLPTPQKGTGDEVRVPLGDELKDWELLPSQPDWAAEFSSRWQPGERGAWNKIERFFREGLAVYQEGRNLPARPYTSELSAHLRWGDISPYQVWHATTDYAQKHPELSSAATAFLRELIWREFSYHLLFFFPDLATRSFNSRFETFPWRNATGTDFDLWARGKTGIPIVDAGMRELWHTGYMHNRVRMIAASFLTKNLLIDWRQGEQWFWDTLVDADQANNPASWQWVAGCGADAAPYFRIFNPELQAAKFDPDQEYIARWVPEAVDPSHPEAASYSPIVDLRETRNRALEAYGQLEPAAGARKA